MPEDFNPRQAALNHAGMASKTRVRDTHDTITRDARYVVDLGDAASSIACGLVYVGDQIGVANGYLSAVVNLLETIDASLANGLGAIADELK